MNPRRVLAEATRFVPALVLAALAAVKLHGGWQPHYSTPVAIFYAAAALEAVVAVLLAVRRTSRTGSVAGCLLTSAFGVWAVGSGNVGDCGCFGSLLPATPAVSIRVAAALGLTCLAHWWLCATPSPRAAPCPAPGP